MKKNKKSYKFHILLWSTLIIFFSMIYIFQKIKLQERVDAIKVVNLELEKETLKYEELLNELESSMTDEFYEKMARTQLGLVKPDEIIFYPK